MILHKKNSHQCLSSVGFLRNCLFLNNNGCIKILSGFNSEMQNFKNNFFSLGNENFNRMRRICMEHPPKFLFGYFKQIPNIQNFSKTSLRSNNFLNIIFFLLLVSFMLVKVPDFIVEGIKYPGNHLLSRKTNKLSL